MELNQIAALLHVKKTLLRASAHWHTWTRAPPAYISTEQSLIFVMKDIVCVMFVTNKKFNNKNTVNTILTLKKSSNKNKNNWTWHMWLYADKYM